MAAQTTYYDVVTRYSIQDQGASGKLDKIDQGAKRADRSTTRANRALGMMTRNLRGLAMVAIPAGGGLLGLAVVVGASAKAFSNLNIEMKGTMTLAAQVNLATAFSADPVQNFNSSLVVSRGLIRGLTRDAASLPGELSDFIETARSISGAVFAGGGDLETIRGLTGRIAIGAPMLGSNARDAPNQAMRILYGTASVGDNPLFAGMMPLFKAMGIGSTQQFNALTAAQRLETFNKALGKLTDNPVLRRQVLRTWETQLGTLSDNLFGTEGIMGDIMRGPFNEFLDALVDFNRWLEINGPLIAKIFGGGPRVLDYDAQKAYLGGLDAPGRSGVLGAMADFLYTDPAGQRKQLIAERAQRMLQMALVGQLATEGYTNPIPIARDRAQQAAMGLGTGEDRALLASLTERAAQQLAYAERKQESDRETKFKSKDVPTNKIEQAIYVSIDAKTDLSPEAFAVVWDENMKRAARSPTTWKGAIPAQPRRGSIGP